MAGNVAYEAVDRLTSGDILALDNQRYLNDFAFELGWKPSYQFGLPGTTEFSSGHLVVEHGLQNSALISFLRRPGRFEDLNFVQRKLLINASYNSLIDWHITVDYDGVTYLHNRIDPPRFYIERRRVSRDRLDDLSSSAFASFSSKHPSPNVPALDAALIRTISFWKRVFASEIPGVSNESISALFNSIILARALEDHSPARDEQRLRRVAEDNGTLRFSNLMDSVLGSFTVPVPETLWNPELLGVFDNLPSSTIREVIEDFYRNRFERYFDYDFSVMSKHALSRVYEHYVSLLRFNDSPQHTMFGSLPEESFEKSYGNVYTPEFISRFFAKYLRGQMPLNRFQSMSVADPACGSGIFLRSIIETKSESLFQERTTRNVNAAFESITGVDIDPNACASAKLSLSLLALILTEAFPPDLRIINADALLLSEEDPALLGAIDVVIANPPFVNIEDLPLDRRGVLLNVLKEDGKGKTDLYLGILKVSLSLLKDGGFGCFVLPKNFLLSENASGIRLKLLQQTEIRCVVDLSSMRVFDDVGAYVVLLIFQKTDNPDSNAPVLAVQCDDLVGLALEDALAGRTTRSPAYQVYWSSQPREKDTSWRFQPPERISLENKLGKMARLGDLVEIRQGIITGADTVFIVLAGEVPKDERAVYVPFLRDREIEPYVVPSKVQRYVIHPFDQEGQLDQTRFEQKYPKTWKYLEQHRTVLEGRRSVQNGANPWWRPIRPRSPEMLLRPKIVTPHLVIAPRFAWDEKGIFAVSHTPYLVPKGPASAEEYLYLLGVLNSSPCFWSISQSAHSYSRGYSRLEVATLRDIPIPSLAQIDERLRREIIDLTRHRMTCSTAEARRIELELDRKVAQAYFLNDAEMEIVGMSTS